MEKTRGKAHAPKFDSESLVKPTTSLWPCLRVGHLLGGVPRHYGTHSKAFVSDELFPVPGIPPQGPGRQGRRVRAPRAATTCWRTSPRPTATRLLCAATSAIVSPTPRGLATHMRGGGHFKTESSPCQLSPLRRGIREDNPALFHTFESWAPPRHRVEPPPRPPGWPHRQGRQGVKRKRGHANGCPGPASSLEGADEWSARRDTPETQQPAATDLPPSPPASDQTPDSRTCLSNEPGSALPCVFEQPQFQPSAYFVSLSQQLSCKRLGEMAIMERRSGRENSAQKKKWFLHRGARYTGTGMLHALVMI